jgi:hypothetical protein
MDAVLTDDQFERYVSLIGYGPHLWEVCDGCNYQTHRCHFCGDDLTHSQVVGVNQTNPCYVDAGG